MQTRSNDGPIQYEDEIRMMTHSEFKKHVLKVTREIEKYTMENNIRIDYVVPILRSGAVPAVYIANELNLIKFAPIQVKKIKQNGKYDHIVLLFLHHLVDGSVHKIGIGVFRRILNVHLLDAGIYVVLQGILVLPVRNVALVFHVF